MSVLLLFIACSFESQRLVSTSPLNQWTSFSDKVGCLISEIKLLRSDLKITCVLS